MVDNQKILEYYREKKVGKRYRHFKGTIYLVSNIVLHCDTLELLVIYQDFQNPSLTWARPLREFESPVDQDKYPEVKQELRFEPLDQEDTRCILTEKGKELIEKFIQECEAKRKEILDAGLDTATNTKLPTIEDIQSDILLAPIEDGCYYGCWGVTDHYESDVLNLEWGLNFYT